MAKPTNVIALIDTDFLSRIDSNLETRDGAYNFYNWMIQKGIKSEQMTSECIGHLINEVFRLRSQNKELCQRIANRDAQ